MGIPDQLFAEPLNSELHCSICFDVLEDPTVIECGHSFCRECVESFFAVQKQKSVACPTCRETVSIDSMIPNITLRCVLSSLQVTCNQPQDARERVVLQCGWEGTLGDWLVHARTDCPHQIVACPIPGCGESFPRRELKKHMRINFLKHTPLLVNDNAGKLVKSFRRIRVRPIRECIEEEGTGNN